MARYRENARRSGRSGNYRRPAPQSYGNKKRVELNNDQTTFDYVCTVVRYVVVVLFILFVIRNAREAYRIGYRILADQPADVSGTGHSVSVEITPGMSTRMIGPYLEEMGVLRDGDIVWIQEIISGHHGEITPGTYVLSSEDTPQAIIRKLSKNYVAETEEGAEEGTEETEDAGDAGTEETEAPEASESTEGAEEGQEPEQP